VVDRRDFGSWLSGPGERTADGQWRGQRLGLPQSGPGSIAPFGVRFVGILIDWAIAVVIARGLFGVPLPFADPPATGGQGFIVLGVLAVMHVLLVGTVGTSFGHRIMGLRVQAVMGGRATFVQALARTILLCLCVPAIIWDRDGRGLHDKVPNTVVVRTR
jgi:uncharacterized RDD family membrane protein YckC